MARPDDRAVGCPSREAGFMAVRTGSESESAQAYSAGAATTVARTKVGNGGDSMAVLGFTKSVARFIHPEVCGHCFFLDD